MAIVDTLLREPGAKCVYVAPFRALVSEVEPTFADLLADLGLRSLRSWGPMSPISSRCCLPRTRIW